MKPIRFHGGDLDGQTDPNQHGLGVGSEIDLPTFPLDLDDLQPGVIYEGRLNVYEIRDSDAEELHAWYIGEHTPRELAARRP